MEELADDVKLVVRFSVGPKTLRAKYAKSGNGLTLEGHGVVGIVGRVGRDRGLFPTRPTPTYYSLATFYAGFIAVIIHLPWRSPFSVFTTARWAVIT